MIKAKVTVFDDETGREYEVNRIIEPVDVDYIPTDYVQKVYHFRFGVQLYENQITRDYSKHLSLDAIKRKDAKK